MTELTADMGEDRPNPLLSTYQRARLRLLAAGLICFALFWFAGAAFRIPVHPRYEASLLTQPGTVVDLLVIAVLLLVGVCVGSLVAGSIRFDAGLFAATLGLSALSMRGGPMRYVLQGASTSSVYMVLVTELLVLYALIALAWWLQLMLLRKGFLHADAKRDGLPDTEHPLSKKLQASFTQIAVMVILMLFLAQTDLKKQVLAAVALSAFISTAASHYSFPVRPSAWFWFGPGVSGVIGYALAFASPGDWSIAVPGNHLANPLPLDYASVGPAFAILGYWMSRRWHRDREAAEAGL